MLQNSTWRSVFRFTEKQRAVTAIDIVSGIPTFVSSCHDYSVNDKIVFASSEAVPCGLPLNTILYVISDGLTGNSFKVSTTQGGSSIALGLAPAGTIPVSLSASKPISLAGLTLDADIINAATDTQATTFTISVTDSQNGLIQLYLSPATTLALSVGEYRYDLSLTDASGDRFYYLTGNINVERTYSRL